MEARRFSRAPASPSCTAGRRNNAWGTLRWHAYGMGWFVNQVGGTTLVSHGGNVPEFSSFLGLLPEQKKGLVLLVNADHGLPFILMEVGEGLAAVLAGQQPPPIRLGFIPWAMRALPLLPLLQIAGIAATVRLLRRWRREPELRPSRGRLGENISCCR